jgi:hypothetical protein
MLILSKILLFENSIHRLFMIQNELDNLLEMDNGEIDDMSDLICQMKDGFVRKYKYLMSEEQIEYIYNI